MKYKEKYIQITQNANKGTCYYIIETGPEDNREQVAVVNLCACFTKKANYIKYISTIKEILPTYKTINFTNLASVCHKLQIEYSSEECFEFVKTIKELAQAECRDVKFVQLGITNFGEVDIEPLSQTIKFDGKLNVIFINNVLMECLKYLGFVSSQIWKILGCTGDFNKIITPDVINTLPVKNNKNTVAHERLKEYLLS